MGRIKSASPRKCLKKNCEGKHYAKGYCKEHYRQNWYLEKVNGGFAFSSVSSSSSGPSISSPSSAMSGPSNPPGPAGLKATSPASMS